MKRSLFLKIWMGFLALIILFAVFFNLFIYRMIREFYINGLSDHYRSIGVYMSEQLKPLLLKGKIPELNERIRSDTKFLNARITVIRTNGVVLADSEAEAASMANHLDRPEVQDVLSGGTGFSLRYSATVHKRMLYSAVPVMDAGKMIGIVRLSLFFDKEEAFIGIIRGRILLIGFLILTASFILAALFSGWITRPIQALIRLSEEFAGGNFKARLYLKQSGEFRVLSERFNLMTEKIEELFGTVTKQNEESRVLMNAIPEGILFLDKKGVILQWNKGMEPMISIPDPRNRHYWEIIRESSLMDFVDALKKTSGPLSQEIGMGGKQYLASGAVLEKQERIILLFHDITGLKDLEVMKKDLIANASHELRTPLTAIKGFLETLEMEPTKESLKKYLPVLQRHTERLIAIVEDLLKLSKMESPEFRINITRINVKDLIDVSTKIFIKKIEDKKLYLRTELFDSPLQIEGDELLLQDMLINLIDNAVKYTDAGEIRVQVDQSGGEILFKITDTGIGIPNESLSRIFERFYVADKSRSRQSGGTGLGLAIVKHIVLLHRGSITVDSIPGKGTTFTVRIPVKLTGN